jgi:hypothetical protein
MTTQTPEQLLEEIGIRKLIPREARHYEELCTTKSIITWSDKAVNVKDVGWVPKSVLCCEDATLLVERWWLEKNDK